MIYSRARHHVDSAHFAERDALIALVSEPWSDPFDAITDIEHACGMTARARVEQVRAVVALISWGLS